MHKTTLAGLARVNSFLIAVLVNESGELAIPIWLEWENWWPLDDKMRNWRYYLPSAFHLMSELISASGGLIDQICISSAENEQLQATINVGSNGSIHQIDAKPNDAITLAGVNSLPVWVADEVMDAESVVVPDAGRESPWTPGASLDESILRAIVAAAVDKRTFHADEVVEGLYISGIRRRPPLDDLRKAGVTHVLRLYSTEVEWPDDFVVFDNPLEDGSLVPVGLFERGVDFIRQARADGHGVLVLCWEGVSRSSTFILAYLIEDLGMDLREAWVLLRERHPKAWPAFQMWVSLITHYDQPYTMDDVRSWLAE